MAKYQAELAETTSDVFAEIDRLRKIEAAAQRVDHERRLDLDPESADGLLRSALGTGTLITKTIDGRPIFLLRISALVEHAAEREAKNPEHYHRGAE
ncbi:MAG: hypothetical protein KOO63_02965 [Bacteroidales bacterium]|nr:hypothetical protein [Candidatus Latescibacterota bacterium]